MWMVRTTFVKGGRIPMAGEKETIQVGALQVRFLVEAEDSNGSVSCFECFVPAQAMMPAPHSHDAFEETIYGLDGVSTWTVDGQVQEIGVGEALSTASTIRARRTRSSSPSRRRESCARNTSARSRLCSRRARGGRLTSP